MAENGQPKTARRRKSKKPEGSRAVYSTHAEAGDGNESVMYYTREDSDVSRKAQEQISKSKRRSLTQIVTAPFRRAKRNETGQD